MIHSLQSHIETFVGKYLPSGKAFGAKHVAGSNLRLLAEAICTEYLNAEITIEEFKEEMMPDSTTNYITYWERVVGIPDHCFPVAPDLVNRRLNVKRKLSLLGLQTKADFENFALSMGLNIKVRSGIDHDAVNGYGTELPAHTFSNAKEARFTVVVTSTKDMNAFDDYAFPFPFQTAEQMLMECVFKHAVPANCNLLFLTE